MNTYNKNINNQELILSLIKGIETKVEILLNAQKENLKIAMDAAEKAVNKAEIAADKRFEGLNELRSMASDWRNEFARQSTVDLQMQNLNERMELLRSSVVDIDRKIDGVISRGIGRNDIWLYLIGGIAAGSGLVIFIKDIVH